MATFTVTAADNLGFADVASPSKASVLLPSATGPGRFSYLWPANTTGILVATGLHRIKFYSCFNATAASIRYVKLYDVAKAPITGTTEPCWRICLPAAAETRGAMADIPFVNGLGIAVTTGQADSDTTAPAAGDVVVNFTFY